MLQAGNHSAGSGCLEDRALSHESILHVDDNQGAAARVDGEKAFPCSAGVGRHGLSLPYIFRIAPEHMTSPGLPRLILPGVRWLIPAPACLVPGAPLWPRAHPEISSPESPLRVPPSSALPTSYIAGERCPDGRNGPPYQ